MKVNINKIAITKRKKTITEFLSDKFNKIFITITYKFLKKIQFNLVRPLGFEPRTSWSVAKRSIQLSYGRIILFFALKNILLCQSLPHYILNDCIF